MPYSLITLEQSKSPISEAYRMLRTNVEFTGVDSETKKILITSPGPREGKSTTAANLAVSIAQTGKSVLLVDSDMRNPSQHKIFDLDNREGLSLSLVQDQDSLKYVRITEVPGLVVLTAGPVPPNPAELLGSQRMKHLIAEVSKKFDVVIFDTPPVIAVADAAILAQEADGVILVLAAGEVNRDYARKAKEQLDKVGAKILGSVLNKVDMKSNDYNYYYHYYGTDKARKKHKKNKKQKTAGE
ncbi:MAG TPA: CpsD/CapB family tyrosine-protein kinase [Desulfitobacteriaceae bacterium]|nr:CpsD/CapB family tyrosine-protein kinase [Desulfitobacteriaceae bacterium]